MSGYDTRFIYTWTQPDGTVEYNVYPSSSLQEAYRVALLWWLDPEPGKMWSQAVHVSVAPETDAHNIPLLEPEKWADLNRRCAEINARCRA